MTGIFQDLRYAIRGLGKNPGFALVAVLTLALGIGGTTAIFTLIHAVMLKSLPVATRRRLYRIGDGDNCCVQGGPQDSWGMFSFPLFERLKAEVPRVRGAHGVPGGRKPHGVRRQGVDDAPRPLRDHLCHRELLQDARCERVHGPCVLGRGRHARRIPCRRDGLSRLAGRLRRRRLDRRGDAGDRGHAFTVAGITPPGFFGETLQADPPDLWVPLQQEPLITAAKRRCCASPSRLGCA